MLHFAPPPLPATTMARALPKRTDSLLASKSSLFNAIDDDLRDARRVHSHGQEEDLKYALQKTMSRIEELTSLLKEAYQTQTDLQTELTLAKSNLQLALSNNEMLEDALKRNPGRGQDVGWKRWSAREEENRRRISEESRTSGDEMHLDSPHPQAESSPTSPVMPPPSANGTSDSRFFKFRFGSGSGNATQQRALSPGTKTLTRSQSSVMPSSPLSPAPNPSPQPSHLASASLPSLIPAPSAKEFAEMKHKLEIVSKQLDEVKKELDQERTKRNSVSEEKERLEGELESLSQALFEEANKMVASERIKRAETEEELKQTLAEKTALKEALRLLERENGELRSASRPQTPASDAGGHRRSASAVAVKSRRSSASSARKSVDSAVFLGNGGERPQEEKASVPEHAPSSSSNSEYEDASSDVSPPETSESSAPSYASYPSFSMYPDLPGSGADSPWADVRSASPVSVRSLGEKRTVGISGLGLGIEDH